MKAIIILVAMILFLPSVGFGSLSVMRPSPVEVIYTEFIFPREYSFEEAVDVADLPASARVIRITMTAPLPESEMSPNVCANVGTSISPTVFGDSCHYGSTGFQSGLFWAKESDPSKLRLTMKDTFNGQETTAGLTGKTVKIWVEYIQE